VKPREKGYCSSPRVVRIKGKGETNAKRKKGALERWSEKEKDAFIIEQ